MVIKKKNCVYVVWVSTRQQGLDLNSGLQKKKKKKKMLQTVTYIMGLIIIGVSVHKYSKSREMVHVAKYRACKKTEEYHRDNKAET